MKAIASEDFRTDQMMEKNCKEQDSDTARKGERKMFVVMDMEWIQSWRRRRRPKRVRYARIE